MRVLVLGGGYAGLALALDLEERLTDAHEIVVVDRTGTHLVQHELHRVVRRPSLADEITLELSTVLDRAEVRVGNVTDVDSTARTVSLANGESLSYDVAAVAIGAGPSLSVPGVAEYAIPLKRIAHAREIHERAVKVLGREDRSRIVVGGAGLSGIQVGGELAALARERATSDAGTGSWEVAILEQADRVAPGFDDPFQRAVRDTLEDHGISVTTDTAIERADDGAVVLDGGARLEYDLLIWTGGITGRETLDGARPRVDATLQVDAGLFGLGDAVRVVDRNGHPVPATAQAAVREATVAARNIDRTIDGDGLFAPRLDQFSFDSPGWVVSIGDSAVAQVGQTVLTGSAALALKTSVGVGYLGSVGSVRDAVAFVNDELGFAVDEK